MDRLITVIAVLLGLSGSMQVPAQDAADQQIKSIENGLAEFTSPGDIFDLSVIASKPRLQLSERMTHYRVPGVSVAVVDDYRVLWARPYGVVRAGTDIAVTNQTRFQAASTSKLVTTVIALRFVDRGLIELDRDVNSYLKSWKVPENEFTRQQKVTLRHLLSHEAGLPTTNFGEAPGEAAPTLVQVLRGESPALNKAAVVERVPGTAWQYSNLGCAVIQMMLEDITGKPFEAIARSTIFEPLGMTASTFTYPMETSDPAAEAVPHDDQGIARAAMLPSSAVAHGGLLTTPSDLAALAAELMRAYRGTSTALLSQAMAKAMFTKVVDIDPATFGMAVSQGLGPLLIGEGENLIFLHPGSNRPGANCWLAGSPGTGRAAVIMTNGAMGEVLGMEILSAVIRAHAWPTGVRS